MTIYRGLNGVNRKIKQQFRGVGGVNREIKEQYRGVGGVNRKVFENKPRGALYWAGDECVDKTGGFGCYYSYGDNGLFQKNADHILFGDNRVDGYANMNIVTQNMIDVTNYQKLYIDYEVIYSYDRGNRNQFGITMLTEKTREPNLTLSTGFDGTANSTPRTTEYLNVSDKSGKFYIAVFSLSAAYLSEQIYGKVYKIWAE